MDPLHLIGGLMLTQTAAVWVLTAAGWNLPLPAWLFPVTGRWRVYLARGYLALTLLGPAAAAVLIPDSPPSRGMSFPNAALSVVWIVVDGLWLGFSAAIVTVFFAMLDLAGDSDATAPKGKAFLPRSDDRTYR